jgi:hypothetical protein
VLSSSGVRVDEAAREYGGRTVIVSWSAISGSRLSDSGTDSAPTADGDGAANAGLSGRSPIVGRASFGSSGTGNGI